MLKDRRGLCILVLFNKKFVFIFLRHKNNFTIQSISSIKHVLAFVTENGEYSSSPSANEVLMIFPKIGLDTKCVSITFSS